jgi:hypothetical protein
MPYYYPNNYPNNYQNNYQNTQAQNNVVWVQGENSAKAYPVAPGNSVLLMDSEESVMYIKSTDQSGMPLPLRIFDYKERNVQTHNSPIANNNSSDYVSRTEFDAFREDITKTLKGIRTPNVSKVGDKNESPV